MADEFARTGLGLESVGALAECQIVGRLTTSMNGGIPAGRAINLRQKTRHLVVSLAVKL